MRPDPVWKRILKALELGPMTCKQLAQCLCLSVWTVYKVTDELRWSGAIKATWIALKAHHRVSLRYSL
jgi:transposase